MKKGIRINEQDLKRIISTVVENVVNNKKTINEGYINANDRLETVLSQMLSMFYWASDQIVEIEEELREKSAEYFKSIGREYDPNEDKSYYQRFDEMIDTINKWSYRVQNWGLNGRMGKFSVNGYQSAGY